ncbi:MAG: aminopeptidase [Halobacteriovoraceae bacterium]|nr:aminopeptidase [Halobacteriovoraceae bacterium]MCB9094113.1 aminopeptidase [Halobacteriovoraceae bacterium]
MKFANIFFLFLLLGCSKFLYLTEQGVGQFKIQWNSREIKEVLEDPKVSPEIKDKILKIQTYKKYFYDYFKKPYQDIYSEVTFLDREAVSHLVIASLFDRVEPHKEWFPFMGEFPYLGFFSKESAEEYAQDMREKDYYTYVRPVYAYSSLGYFEDRILSSFFQYDDYELAEMVFHEIFHTVFFVKDNVDVNENLANYFGKQLMQVYFKFDAKEKEKLKKEEELRRQMRDHLVGLIREYKKELVENKPKNMKESRVMLDKFLKKNFLPSLEKKCQELKLKTCHILEGDWNNARFAAYMTYEKKGDFISKLRDKVGGDLRNFLAYLDRQYQNYNESKPKISFEKYLEGLIK